MTETLENDSAEIVDKVRAVGDALATTLRSVLAAVPGRPTRPNLLSRELGLNRATASRVLKATSRHDPLEVAHVIPGPEPLRSFLQAAAAKNVSHALIATATEAVDRFDELIRNDTGTRSALDAIISSNLPSARDKFELASKYSIFKGMSQLKGARADTWLGTAVVTPSDLDPTRHDLTWLTGAFGIQRLRTDVAVSFSYRALRGDKRADDETGSISSIPMGEFCSNPPARVVAESAGDVIHYTLPDDARGPRHTTDMLVVDDHPAAMKCHARPEARNHSSLFVEPAFPVALLVFDLLLHQDAFPEAQPELVVYDTGTKGIANVNDESRDIDRMRTNDAVEPLGNDMRTFKCDEIPRYGEMLARLCERLGWDPAEYRGYRCRMQYPVYGWQIAMSFEPPALDD